MAKIFDNFCREIERLRNTKGGMDLIPTDRDRATFNIFDLHDPKCPQEVKSVCLELAAGIPEALTQTGICDLFDLLKVKFKFSDE